MAADNEEVVRLLRREITMSERDGPEVEFEDFERLAEKLEGFRNDLSPGERNVLDWMTDGAPSGPMEFPWPHRPIHLPRSHGHRAGKVLAGAGGGDVILLKGGKIIVIHIPDSR